MSLKIIGGQWRGRNLMTLKSLDTRPTANRTREALFNILSYKVKDARVLDLFAGSGALGLEALSRGAAEAVFVESDPKACEIIAKNIAFCGAQSLAELYCGRVAAFKGRSCGFDLILLDPPYGGKLVDASLRHLAQESLPVPGATVVAEHETGFTPVFDSDVFSLIQSRVYGKATLSFFAYQPCEREQND